MNIYYTYNNNYRDEFVHKLYVAYSELTQSERYCI